MVDGEIVPGPPGPPGPPGRSGPVGEVGRIGPAGVPGEEGAPGPRGGKGDRGPAGTPGDNGERGEPGRTGQSGEPGTKVRNSENYNLLSYNHKLKIPMFKEIERRGIDILCLHFLGKSRSTWYSWFDWKTWHRWISCKFLIQLTLLEKRILNYNHYIEFFVIRDHKVPSENQVHLDLRVRLVPEVFQA